MALDSSIAASSRGTAGENTSRWEPDTVPQLFTVTGHCVHAPTRTPDKYLAQGWRLFSKGAGICPKGAWGTVMWSLRRWPIAIDRRLVINNGDEDWRSSASLSAGSSSCRRTRVEVMNSISNIRPTWNDSAASRKGPRIVGLSNDVVKGPCVREKAWNNGIHLINIISAPWSSALILK